MRGTFVGFCLIATCGGAFAQDGASGYKTSAPPLEASDSSERWTVFWPTAVQAPIESELEPALTIVRERKLADYPSAVRQLRALIAQGGAAERDATTWLQWLETDVQVRLARRLYNQGERDAALPLLQAAYRHEVLGPEPKATIRRGAEWMRATDPPTPAPSPELVTTSSGRQVPRSLAMEFKDPSSGRPFYVWLKDPAAPKGQALLDLLARGEGPQAPAKGISERLQGR